MNQPDGEDRKENEAAASRRPDAGIPRAHFTPLSECERAAIHARPRKSPRSRENRYASIRRGIAWVLLIILILLAVFLALNGG